MPRRDVRPSPRPPDGLLERAVDATGGRLAAIGLALGSRLRGRRAFHPRGEVLHATLVVTPSRPVGARLLDEPAEHRCTVRLSRGVGLLASVPDVLGVALSVSAGERTQDLLFATILAGDGPGRHLLAPARSFADRPYATLFPDAAARGRVHLLLQPLAAAGDRLLDRPEAAAAALASGELSFDLQVRADGETTPVGCVTGGRLEAPGDGGAIRFNPFRAADDLRPVGLLNALRHRACAVSQAARPDG